MSDQQQPPVYKIALGIEYDGSKYYGWQRQNEVRSVQEKLEKVFLDNFGENDWYGGFEDYVKECSVYLEKASAGNPVRASLFIPILIMIGLSMLAAAVVVAVIWQKMETVSKKTTANAYVSAGLRLTEKTDHFTHKTTSSRKIERSSSSDGSSYSESGGGGSGRSGKF
jgi:uncharacterized membrane protein YgcG